MEGGFRHDGHSRTRLCLVVDAAIDDRHALKVFLNDFFANHFDILLWFTAGAFPQAVGGMLLHLDPNLFGDVSPSGQFGYSLTHQFSFTQIALALSDEKLVGMVGGRRVLLRPVSGCWCNSLFSCAKLLKVLVGMRANVLRCEFPCHGGCGHKQSPGHPYCHENVTGCQRHGYLSL